MTVCLLKRKLNIQGYGENHGEAIMNLAHSRRKMKDDLCEATLNSLAVSHDSSLVTEMRLEGPPCTHTRTDPGWSRAGRRRSRVNVGELSAERSFWRRSFVPVRDASSLITPSSQLFTLKYPPKLVFNSQSRFQFESFMQPTVR